MTTHNKLQALASVVECDPNRMAEAAALALHDIPAYLTPSNRVLNNGRLFTDSYTGKKVVLTWALPKGAGWVRAAVIEIVLDATASGGCAGHMLVKSVTGVPYAQEDAVSDTTLGKVLTTLHKKLFTDPTGLVRECAGASVSDSSYRSVRRASLILANVAMAIWCLVVFLRTPGAATATDVFWWGDPLVFLGILVAALVSISWSRRRYLDAVLAANSKAAVTAFTGGDSDYSGRPMMSPSELMELEVADTDMGSPLSILVGPVFLLVVMSMAANLM